MDPVAPGLYSASAVINEMQGTMGVLLSALVSYTLQGGRGTYLIWVFFLVGEAGARCVI